MENKTVVLIIEKNKSLMRLVSDILKFSGFGVLKAYNQSEGLSFAVSHCPECILLNSNLNDQTNTLTLLRQWYDSPVIIMSEFLSETDFFEFFKNGADDVIEIPYSPAVLVARIKNALMHKRIGFENREISVSNIKINPADCRVIVNSIEVQFTRNEFRVMKILCSDAGKVLTHDYIVRGVWGPNAQDSKGVLRVHMASIRKKLAAAGLKNCIRTVSGIGYELVPSKRNFK
ncbi:MAG: response regulator transcription factor [Bacillota bacterium]|nr:response regulator transcription factor [Bacillota bacterium]